MRGNDFFFKRGRIACLLVHGLTGSSQEVEELGRFLVDKGFTVKGVLLKGHNTSVDELDRTRWNDWYHDVVESYKWLAKSYKKIYVIGLSMGAVLCLHLAAEFKVEGIVALAPAIFFKDWKTKFVPVAKYFMRFKKKNYNRFYPHRKYSPWDILSDEAYKERIAYKIISLRALGSGLDLIDKVRTELGRISCPILIIHSKKDHTADIKSADFIYSNISSVKKEKILLEKSGHVITVDVEKKKVFKDVLDFLAK